MSGNAPNVMADLADLDEMISRAFRLHQEGEHGDEAFRLNSRILELCDDGEAPAAAMQLGCCLEARGEQALALEFYERAVKGGLRGQRALIAEARIRALTSRITAAERERLIREEIDGADQFETIWQLARALRQMNSPKLALQASEKALQLAVGSREQTLALNTSAAILRDLERPRDALDRLGDSLTLDPSPKTNTPAYSCLVGALCDLGSLDEAVQRGQPAADAAPDDPYLLRAMGRLYRKLIERNGFSTSLAEKAEACFERALHLEPREPDAIAALGQLIALYQLVGEDARAARLGKLLISP